MLVLGAYIYLLLKYMSLSLDHWSSTEVDFVSQGHLAQGVETLWIVTLGRRMLLALSRQRPETLPTILQGPGQTAPQPQMSTASRMGNPALDLPCGSGWILFLFEPALVSSTQSMSLINRGRTEKKSGRGADL